MVPRRNRNNPVNIHVHANRSEQGRALYSLLSHGSPSSCVRRFGVGAHPRNEIALKKHQEWV
jgi:hypothetical protein